MSLLIKGGITRLSELIIDADKNWQAMGISNLEELALGMTKGDFAVKGDAVLQRLQPTTIGYVLTSAGPLHIPSWQPPPGALLYYFPVPIDLSHTEAIVLVNQSYNKNAPLTREHKEAYLDAPADYIKRLTPAIALTDAEAIVAAAQIYNQNAPVTRKYDLEIVVGGASAEDGGVFTDETAAAQNAVANDMTLLPAAPAVNDAYYFGHAKPFDVEILNIGTQGAGVWTITWEYWNGAWVALAGVTDGTAGFTAAAGKREVPFTRPGDWLTTNSGGNLPANIYWIRARVSAYTSIVTQPKGTQAWIRIIT